MLELTEVVKRYGDVTALDGCTFTARPGRLTGLLGPNGAGKTTAMRAIFGLVRPDAGAVHWKGQPVTQAQWRRFGYMPEERGVYPRMRARDQIAHFGHLAGLSRKAALRAADMWLGRLGLADRAGSRVEELSHGNQQRIQLAIALAHDPPLLVLDEPFSGLDPLAVDDLAEVLRDLAREGRTILFSSHQLDLVEDLCEDVVTLDHGRVVLAGTLEALRAAAPRRQLHVEVAGSGDKDLLVDRATPLSALVADAAAAGEILRLDYDPPSLSDLFREAVTR